MIIAAPDAHPNILHRRWHVPWPCCKCVCVCVSYVRCGNRNRSNRPIGPRILSLCVHNMLIVYIHSAYRCNLWVNDTQTNGHITNIHEYKHICLSLFSHWSSSVDDEFIHAPAIYMRPLHLTSVHTYITSQAASRSLCVFISVWSALELLKRRKEKREKVAGLVWVAYVQNRLSLDYGSSRFGFSIYINGTPSLVAYTIESR